MAEQRIYTNQNLAGILSVALGLEDGAGRASFSGAHRETLRAALEDPSRPGTFRELYQTLRRLQANESTLRAVEALAGRDPGRSLQQFAVEFGRSGSAAS